MAQGGEEVEMGTDATGKGRGGNPQATYSISTFIFSEGGRLPLCACDPRVSVRK